MFIIGNTSNPLVAIPSINYDIKKNTLNKLIMAYFLFQKRNRKQNGQANISGAGR